MTARVLIGVTGPKGRGWAMWACAAFSLWLHGARARRITPPFEPADLEGLDGLLIGGGDDIGATLYNGEPTPDVRLDPERDALEIEALERFWPRPQPILGICRGSQLLNVFRGGRLHQDAWATYEGARRMRTPLPLRRVAVKGGTRLAEALGRERLTVNSLHNQAVGDLGRDIVVAARDEHGMTQAVEASGDLFRIGVQWHPEFLFYKRAHRRLFRAFVAAAKEARAHTQEHPRAAA